MSVIEHDEVTPLAAGDPTPPAATPLILNDAYFELGGVNLRCLVKHLEIVPENKPVTVTSFCAETDYPGVTKWHLRVTFYQSFDAGATFATLNAAYTSYVASGASVNFKARPYSSRVAAANNPIISGQAIPMPFEYLVVDDAVEVAVEGPQPDDGHLRSLGHQALPATQALPDQWFANRSAVIQYWPTVQAVAGLAVMPVRAARLAGTVAPDGVK